ncbi:MAG: MauE/DoxX family redox-associated membrane protein, partial [Sediminibacterium sp.]
MQSFLKILRWTVGLLFIFSGLIKANDPLGLSYKMQEFFEVWGIAFLDDYTLVFAVVMNTLEIVAGIALLIKFPYKQTL